MGETETPLLEGTHKVSCTAGPGQKQCVSWRGGGVAMTHCGGQDTGGRRTREYSPV